MVLRKRTVVLLRLTICCEMRLGGSAAPPERGRGRGGYPPPSGGAGRRARPEEAASRPTSGRERPPTAEPHAPRNARFAVRGPARRRRARRRPAPLPASAAARRHRVHSLDSLMHIKIVNRGGRDTETAPRRVRRHNSGPARGQGGARYGGGKGTRHAHRCHGQSLVTCSRTYSSKSDIPPRPHSALPTPYSTVRIAVRVSYGGVHIILSS